ncbi:cytochrome c oxidase subunit 3 [Thioclava atlantica]|uniref:Cytochrome bo(3) ubiquinol oxidase subunit 3 n=1 Tax=Thioclava atlantica TaxID=1317124 RepID=A0A085TU04_9RHOB|nr:cytochrome c oxidase subunit 3 [Thioclava atlantica]KFE34201.1 cytochrome c oxidase subunit III [Thioclava atlantica]
MSATQTRHPGLNLGSNHQSADDRAETEVFGFWVFMMSDAILFGLLMATYVVMRPNTNGGPGPHDLFELKSIFIETMLLLASSVAIGFSHLALKHEDRPTKMVIWLVVAMALALAFVGFEIHDFLKMAGKGGVPQASGFLSAFFALVPLHGLHVSAACLWGLAILGQLARYGLDDGVKVSMVRLAVLWHFLDLVWIGIFSLVYIGGLA